MGKTTRLSRDVKEVRDAHCNVGTIGAVVRDGRHDRRQFAGGGVRLPGDCSYTSYNQCMASASGRALYCNVNPRVAFGQQQRMRIYRDY
jgi:hypothetical protein